MIKLSKTAKLGTLSWSLQAFDDCPGKTVLEGPNKGKIAEACQMCYARNGNYRFKPVKDLRAHNRQDWTRAEWVAEMVILLDGETHFRWFDSGDMYALELAEKILDVMRQTPGTKHWLPTRMEKFEKFRAVVAQMRALPNVMVRWSSDSVTGKYGPEHGSVIVADAKVAPVAAKVCRAYTREGKCGTCRACYDKSIPLIAYPAHGRSAPKVIRLALAA